MYCHLQQVDTNIAAWPLHTPGVKAGRHTNITINYQALPVNKYTNYRTVPLSPIQLDNPTPETCTIKIIQPPLTPEPQQWWPRCYTNQPFHGERTPIQSLVYPPHTATPKQILTATHEKLKNTLQSLATVIALRGLREAFPNITLWAAGGVACRRYPHPRPRPALPSAIIMSPCF